MALTGQQIPKKAKNDFWIRLNKESSGLTGLPRWTLEKQRPMLAAEEPAANVVR